MTLTVALPLRFWNVVPVVLVTVLPPPLVVSEPPPATTIAAAVVVSTSSPPLVKATDEVALLPDRLMAVCAPVLTVLVAPEKVKAAPAALLAMETPAAPELVTVRAPVTSSVPPTPSRRMPLPVLEVARTAVALMSIVVLVMSRTARLLDSILPAVVLPRLSVPPLLARMPLALKVTMRLTVSKVNAPVFDTSRMPPPTSPTSSWSRVISLKTTPSEVVLEISTA